MKKFAAVFLGSDKSMSAWHQLDAQTRAAREQEGMQAWGAWVEKHKGSIVEMGSPLGKTKLVNKAGVSDTKNMLTAYTVVQAESHQAAAEMFRNHPHFSIFPGDAVEVMECLPIPGQ